MTYIATAPKSNRAGVAYWAAAGDVETKGSLPVPLHLRQAGDRRMKHHGIGVGYLYPQEYEGADVDQQYLPDELAERHYYLPTDQGYEATISARQVGRAEARAAAKQTGKTPRSRNPSPEVSRSDLMRTRESTRKKLAETERRDAGG
jgi:replication-associated recombination protein RarA